jgi:hypothetical protein
METVWVTLDLSNQSSKSADVHDGIMGTVPEFQAYNSYN